MVFEQPGLGRRRFRAHSSPTLQPEQERFKAAMDNNRDYDSLRPHSSVPGYAARRVVGACSTHVRNGGGG